MGGLSLQKRLASEILKLGQSRVWMDTEHLEEIKNAITRSDIKKMISHGYIREKKPKVKVTNLYEKGAKKGYGKRKGAKGTRLQKKRRWMNTIRPLRRMLKDLKNEEKIDKNTYRKIYLLTKAGTFRSRSHLRLYLQQRGILSEDGT